MEKKKSSQLAMVFIIFGIVCLLSALIFSLSKNSILHKKIPLEGRVLGPITVDQDNTVYQINVYNPFGSTNQWCFISGEVLNEKKDYLFGFGQELWKESGYDSDGAWTESKTNYDMKITLQKGTYYLGFESESSTPTGYGSDITIQVEKLRGSSLYFFIAGIVGLIIGVIMNEIANQTITTFISTMSPEN
jgi:hypothetical protein